MKVKGGGKRKLANPVLSNAVEENNGRDSQENDENNNHSIIDGANERRENQEQEKEKEEEENNDEDEEEEEEEEEEEDEEGAQDEAQEERPKLDEGFFEIEAIRRRRVRKGQLQYLIKWRGWPENANTWEPLENLQSCSDVIDAFEESLRSGKSSRKRKRKGGGSSSLSKKKQPRSFSAAYNVTTGGVGQSLPSAPLFSTSLNGLPTSTQFIGPGHEEENNGDVNNAKTTKQTNENRFANGSKLIEGRNEETEYDPKLSELKGMISNNEVNADKHASHFQEAKVSEGNGLTHGHPKVDRVEQVCSDRRTGAKRRKSGSVKRFKQDLASSKLVVNQDSTPSIAIDCDGTNNNDKIEGPRNSSAIVKIIRAVSFSASVSNDVQDVVVTFMAARSDGKEVIVDNKYLKANNPLLLINFYEQNLKYHPQCD